MKLLNIPIQKYKGKLSKQCEDYSDQVFVVNQNCTEKKYVEAYKNNICKGNDIYKEYTSYDEKICANVSGWLDKTEHNSSEYLDPHNCYGSCNDPGYGCLACSNKNYFRCTKNTTPICIHPDLVCNHHPDCDNAEDEDFHLKWFNMKDGNNCYDELIRKNLVPQYATLKCLSKIHPNMHTIATVCDGLQECEGNEDETNTCNSSNTVGLIILSFALCKLYLMMKFLRWYKRSKKTEEVEKTGSELFRNIDFLNLLTKYAKYHDDQTIIENVNTYLIHVKYTELRVKRTEFARIFYNNEEKIHGKNEAAIFSCMHARLVPANAKLIIDHKFPSSIRKIFYPITDRVEALFLRYEWLQETLYTLKKILRLFTHAADLFKDCHILVSMIVIVGGLQAVLEFWHKFSSMVIICSASTILFPILVRSMHLGKTEKILYHDFLMPFI